MQWITLSIGLQLIIITFLLDDHPARPFGKFRITYCINTIGTRVGVDYNRNRLQLERNRNCNRNQIFQIVA